MDLKREIILHVESLSLEQQRQVLAYFDALKHTLPRGENGTALLPFSGILDHTSAAEMNEAIESACEAIDSREW